MLLCIGRFFDDNACSSSMSYAQVARECGLHEVTAKKTANAVKDRWLRIGVGKGFYVPGKGAQNLYHGICPPELVERLREERRKGRSVPRDAEVEKAAEAAAGRIKSGVVSNCTGVASDYPEPQSGVVSGYPEGDRGSPGLRPGLPQTTRTQIDSDEEKTDSLGAEAPGAVDTTLFSDEAPSEGAPPPSKGSPCKPSKADIDAALADYVETAKRCGLPVPRKPAAYLDAIAVRLREGSLDEWREMLAIVERSPHLRGENDRVWKANLGWLAERQNYAKVLDGIYLRNKPKPKPISRY